MNVTLHKFNWHRSFSFLSLLIGVLLAGSQLQNKYFKSSKAVTIFADILRELHAYYVDDIDQETLVRTGFDAMLHSLDPYTSFLTEDELENFQTYTIGEYGGIGAVIGRRTDKTIILMLYKDGPAHKAGLRVGDELIQVNGEEISDKPIAHVSSLLKGMPSTSVQLSISRHGIEQTLTVTVARDKVLLKNVLYSGHLEENVGYIRLANFSTNATEEVKAALESLKKEGVQKLILDLRGNPGGMLEEAIGVVNLFIERGKAVVITSNKMTATAKTHTTTQPAYDTTLPIIVLIDQGSASAAEIVAGVIQDYDRGILMGKNTFGKGLVQTTRPLSHNAQLKLTTARYYTPSGRSIQKVDRHLLPHGDGARPTIKAGTTPFTTHAGRPVCSGKGISPDIETNNPRLAPITISLIRQNLIFDYATHFQAVHDDHSIPAKDFVISADQYEDFVTWLQDKNLAYTLEPRLDELLKQAQRESYGPSVQEQIALCKKYLQLHQQEDLRKFAEEIKLVLKEEIVARYYFQKGAIEAMLNHDQNIQQACTLFQDMTQYYSLLQPAR